MNPLIHKHRIPTRISVEILGENSWPLKESKSCLGFVQPGDGEVLICVDIVRVIVLRAHTFKFYCSDGGH